MLPKPSTMACAVSRTDMMSLTCTRRLSATPRPRNVCACIFSALPITRSISGMAAKRSGSICAAQPVTMICAAGFSRRSLRMVCVAWRTASPVTAQVLTITASSQAGIGGVPAHHLGFVGVEAAAEGDDADCVAFPLPPFRGERAG